VSALGLILSACSSSTPAAGTPPNPTGPVAVTSSSTYTLQTTAAVPGVPTGAVAGSPNGNASWVDISAIDTGGTGYYLVADKANAGVTEINPSTNTYVATAGKNGMGGFAAAVNVNGGQRQGGPNGIVVVGGGIVFVGDTNSNLQVVNTATNAIVSPTAGCTRTNLVVTGSELPGPSAAGPLAVGPGGAKICGWYTGGFYRLDEGAYDATDNIVMYGNDEEQNGPPFITFFSSTACATTTATAAQCILGKLTLTGANVAGTASGGGLEQPQWDSAQNMFLVNLPGTVQNPGGEVDVINPRTQTVATRFATPANCNPQGLSLKQSTEVMLIGCSSGSASYFMSATTGSVVGTFGISGCDESYYNPTDNRFYVACSNNTLPTNVGASPATGSANPVTAVLDGTSLNLITVIQTTASAHSVAADPVTNKVFIPMLLSTGSPVTSPGGVAIFSHS
jgi:hypothetical protein